ncbi:unnamed protein product [Mytilus coruscus]|uniref:Uncharacterized protein n=1 Tax=Mytilus coruscus TaxID=42192 RepID=A0A6J8CEW4_MYTCO|nr:unnamed protein product [Mytilus coruscus]
MISNLEYQSPLGKSDHCTMKFDFNCYTNIKKKAKENPKAIWSYIKSKTKTKEGIGDLHIDPEDTKSDKTEDNSTKAKILVDYFSSVFTNEPDGEVPTPNQVPVINEMSKQKIKEEVVLKHLSALQIDKSPGMDPRLLKEIAESIAKPLCIIFNQSLESKTVPNDWKNAMISAIFKKGNKSLAKNYRSVSLTSVVCKIMEKILREFIIEHMKTNNLFSKKQYGFIAGRSTGLQLLEVIDKWTEALDQGLDIDCGDVMYKYICQTLNLSPRFLIVSELPSSIQVGGIIFKLDNGIDQLICSENLKSQLYYVDTSILCSEFALNLVFHSAEQNQACIVIFCDCAIAIIKDGNRYAVYDPHSRNEFGFCSGNGKCLVSFHDSLQSLCAFLRNLCGSLTTRELQEVQYDMVCIQLTKAKPSTKKNHSYKIKLPPKKN